MDEESKKILAAHDDRIDQLDTRLTRVETTVEDIREENRRGREDNRRGFDEIMVQLNHLYAERAEWGKIARANLNKIVNWLLWLIPALVGVRFMAGKFFEDN